MFTVAPARRAVIHEDEWRKNKAARSAQDSNLLLLRQSIIVSIHLAMQVGAWVGLCAARALAKAPYPSLLPPLAFPLQPLALAAPPPRLGPPSLRRRPCYTPCAGSRCR